MWCVVVVCVVVLVCVVAAVRVPMFRVDASLYSRLCRFSVPGHLNQRGDQLVARVPIATGHKSYGEALFYGETDAVVVFRGAQCKSEMLRTLYAGLRRNVFASSPRAGVHAGWWAVYARMGPMPPGLHRAKNVHIVGFSMGAVFAQFLAAQLLEASAGTSRISVCLIGSPRAGDTGFADVLADVAGVLLENSVDVVPHLPPSLLGFVHAPHYRRHVFTHDAGSARRNHSLATYMAAVVD
jgi:hypothetical protein